MGAQGTGMKVLSAVRLINALCFLSLLPVPVHALTPAQVFDKVKDAAVVVKTLDARDKVKGQGSGVLLPSGKVATNCHVVEGGASFRVGRGKELFPATLIAEDGDKDICLLDAPGVGGKPAEPGKAADLKAGDPVYAVGASRGSKLALSEGVVAQLRGRPSPLIPTTVPISAWSSGGGLFDGQGRLVGVTSFYIGGGQSLSFAMPVEWIDEVKPGRIPAASGVSYTDWCERAMTLEEKEDWPGLLDWCRKWTQSEPKSVDAWCNLGFAYGVVNLNDDAIKACRQAIKISPKSIDALTCLGAAYDGAGHFNDAIEAYRRAILIDPQHARSWYELGTAYFASGNQRAAFAAVRELRRIDPAQAEELLNVMVPTLGVNNREQETK